MSLIRSFLRVPICSLSKVSSLQSHRSCSSSSVTKNEEIIEAFCGRPKGDPVAEAFFKPSVQMCLGRITGLDYSKVFRVARRGQKIRAPTYVFMTDAQLKEAQKDADRRARQKWLQMPPVLSPRNDEPQVLDFDPAIQGYDAAKYVFTDITYGIHDRARLIVVREPDGTLREANGKERDRLNQIYFPREGRKINIPLLFKDPQVLKEVLELGGDRYLYILDRNCVQFEPDHPLYVQTAEAVYAAVDEKRDYHILKSTRFYGPLIFYLVWNKRCDNFIAYQLKQKNISEVFDTVHLYSLLHPSSKVGMRYSDTSSSSSESSSSDDETELNFGDKLEMVRTYIKEDSSQEIKLNIALESLLELKAKELEVTKGISEAHGAKK